MDNDIVDIHENCINNISYNTKLVNKVDELAVADMGATVHYLTLDSTCDNKKIAVITLPIQIPDREIITPTNTALLSKTDPPIEAWKAHLFPGLNKAWLSIGSFCDHGFQELFDDKKLLILNKGNGKIMMKGRRDPLSKLCILNLIHRNNLMTEFHNPDECFAESVYD